MSFILPGGLGQNLGRVGIPKVQVSTSAKVDPSVNNVFSFPMTSAAGNTGLVLFGVGYPNPADGTIDESPKLTVRWAAQTMTRIGGYADATSGMNIFAFGVVNPTSGAQSLQITGMSNYYAAATAGVYQGFIAIAFTGSNTSSVANAFKNWTAPAISPVGLTTFSFPVTSAANNLVVGSMWSLVASPVSLSSSSGTLLQNIDISNTPSYSGPFVSISQPGAPSSTVSFTWSKNVNAENMAGLSVSP